MIADFDNIPKLSDETKRLLAEFSGSKYFDALKELAEIEFINMSFSRLMTPSISNDELRYWQGYPNGITALLLRLKQIQADIFKTE